MAKFPINKRIMDNSGFVKNFAHLSRVSKSNFVSPYTYGAGTTQYGKFGKYNQGEYIPSVGIGEEVLSEAKEKEHIIPVPIIPEKPKYKIYFLTNQTYNVNSASELTFDNGTIDFYIVNDLTLPEPCTFEIIDNTILLSKRIFIYNSNSSEYTWTDNHTSVIINHNLSGLVDYVLRYKGVTRILTTSQIINANQIKIYMPEQIELNANDYFELIIYNISVIPEKENVFTSTVITDITQVESSNSIMINNNLNSLVVDSVLRDDNR